MAFTAGNDKQNGTAGNDRFDGLAGDDTIMGLAGNDTLIGNLGNDKLDGGAGNDTVAYGGKMDGYQLTYDESSKAWTIKDIDTSDGDDGTDIITRMETAMFSDQAKDLTSGTTPIELPVLSIASVKVTEGAKGDTIDVVLTVTMSVASEETVTVNYATKNRTATSGKDYTAKTGALTFEAGTTTAEIQVLIIGDATREANETFTVTLSRPTGATLGSAATATVTIEDDDTGGVGGTGGLPPDTRTYDLTLPLSKGADVLQGSILKEKLQGLGGDDNLNGKEGNDHLDGGVGNDSLYGSVGDDYLLGGTGNDILDGAKGRDSIDGGEGDDSISDSSDYEGSDGGLIVGGNGNDTISAGSGNDSITGGDGNDTIDGSHGNDSITGGGGNDTISAGSGNDSITGGDGDDSIDGGEGDDVIRGGEGDDTITDAYSSERFVQKLYGEEGNDTLYGDDQAYGGSGDDKIYTALFQQGDAGNDQLLGYSRYEGYGGGYYYSDSNSSEIFYGGAGADTITTGSQADTIRYIKATDSPVGVGLRDIITDFDTASGDVIDLSRLSAKPLTFLSVASFTGKAGEVRLELDPPNQRTIVSIDLNGDKAADMEIELTGLILASDDFVLSQPTR